ncbi:MOB kinase activator-like 3 [Sarcoptes scabiei]|uniref:MOB kinase activator-like 3 n=1 Tax=Sarcoptes scabiei TaxID=52283 RepID=A0A834R3Y7_SARSC|nr:MOB kinase activator-like 3 [Sarcoptes scabiei]
MASMSSFVDFFSKSKKVGNKNTFRPKKKFEPGTLRYSLHKQAIASLNSGINLREVVKLPDGEDLCDWIAVHVVDFFNRINLIYGIVTDYCTDESCPRMSGGQKYEYLWADGVNYKKPVSLPANKYISLLMDWIESQINNESLFPTKNDIPFPKTFIPNCKKILARLFRVFVHVYIHHFDRLMAVGAEAHCNTCYKHFYYFVKQFDLVNAKEFEPLSELTLRLCEPHQAFSQSSSINHRSGSDYKNGK